MKFEIDALPPEEKRWLTEDEYQFIFKRAPMLCLDFVVVQNGGILLAQREIEPFLGFWTLPGGMVRYKETIDQASDRILLNELGVKLAEKRLIGFIESHNDGPYRQSISMVFLTKVLGKIRGSEQGHNLKFFSKLPEKTHPYQKEFFEKNWQLITA